MNGRGTHGHVASALSVAELPYADAEDGISPTSTVTPDGLGRTPEERIANLAGLLDGHTANDGLHTALDTSGFLGARATDALLRDTDLVLLDVKSWDPATHREVTGRPPGPARSSARTD